MRRLRFGKRIIGCLFTFSILTWLLVACEKPDSKLRKQVIGTWIKDDGEMILDANGAFSSQWRRSNGTVAFFGSWEVKNGTLQFTETNIDSGGFTNVTPVGHVDSSRITQADASRLGLEFDGKTNLFTRK